MILGDVLGSEAKIFFKSEWGPISADWPALSFTHQRVGRRLRADLAPARDVVVYVGTGNPETTRDERHRRRLLSVLRVEPNQVYATEDLVPRDSWLEAQEDFPGRFIYSFPVTMAWEIDDFPLASDIAPIAYSNLGQMQYRGDVVEVSADERRALERLRIRPLELEFQAVMDRIRSLTSVRDLPRVENEEMVRMERFITDPDDAVNGDIARMVSLIKDRASRSGSTTTHVNPYRSAPPTNTGLIVLLTKKWFAQNKRCALCMGRLVPQSPNPLLQPSPDRIDSSNPNYDEANLAITHLACNLAKNKCSVPEFDEWLEVLRGDSSQMDVKADVETA